MPSASRLRTLHPRTLSHRPTSHFRRLRPAHHPQLHPALCRRNSSSALVILRSPRHRNSHANRHHWQLLPVQRSQPTNALAAASRIVAERVVSAPAAAAESQSAAGASEL
jgi:hypothetical protein